MTNQVPESDVKDYLDPDYYDLVEYGTSSLHLRDQQKNIMSLIEPYADLQILDIGSGSGKYAAKMSHKATITALDFSPVAVAAMQRTAEQHGQVNKIRVVQSKGEELPLTDETFDMITALDVVEHISYRAYQRMVEEAYRVLKHGGKFCIYTPNRHYFLEYLYPLIFRRPWIEVHIGLMSMDELTTPLLECGFQLDIAETKPSYIPGLRQIESVLMRLPMVGQYWQRRLVVRAIKP